MRKVVITLSSSAKHRALIEKEFSRPQNGFDHNLTVISFSKYNDDMRKYECYATEVPDSLYIVLRHKHFCGVCQPHRYKRYGTPSMPRCRVCQNSCKTDSAHDVTHVTLVVGE